MKLWIIVWLGLVGFANSALTSNKQILLLDDGVPGDRGQLVGPRPDKTKGKELEEEEPIVCLPDHYLEEGECIECYEHDDSCTKSRQCCGVDHMSCWKYGYNPPMCKCDPDYAWNATSGECYPAPLPSVLLVTAYTALGAACVVGVCAILIHACSCCKKRWTRSRYGQTDSSYRHQFRGQRSRDPPRVPLERRLSSTIPNQHAESMADKPPLYEDVYGMPTIGQALQRTTNGSIRSLPPAYTPHEDDCKDTEVKSSHVIDPSGAIEQSDAVLKHEEQPSQGIVNPSFTTEHHI